jgi:hypothetical protein
MRITQPNGPRLLRQGGFETRPYINLDPSTVLDPVCRISLFESERARFARPIDGAFEAIASFTG